MIYAFADCELDTVRHELRRSGEACHIEPQVFDLLVHLVRNKDRLVSRDELLDAVWGHRFISPDALNSRIKSARQAVGDDGRSQGMIRTLRGRGFRFLAEVRELGGSPAATVEAATPAPVPPAPPAGIVDRPAERAALGAALADARAGRRRIVVIGGEPGIGKTTLVDMLMGALGPDVRVARGQCIEQSGPGEPFLPILDALGRLHRGPGGDELPGVLERWAPSLLLQMPGLIEAEARRELAASAGRVTRRHMLRQVVEALEKLAREAPLALLLEDLHWSDPSTLDLLAWLATRSEPARMLVVVTWRPTDARSRVRDTIRRLGRSPGSSHLTLHGLGRDEIEALLALRFPGAAFEPGLPLLILERTGGNPLFAGSLLDAWVESGVIAQCDGAWRLTVPPAELADAVPASLQDSLDARLERLPAADRSMLIAASAAGTEFAAALVAAALDRPEVEVEERLLRVVRRRWILHPVGEADWPDGSVSARFAFAHQVYRDVLYRRTSGARRAHLHRAMGRRLETAFQGHEQEQAGELAAHFLRGRDPERAVRFLGVAAMSALERNAHLEAAEHARTALELLARHPELPNALESELPLQLLFALALLETRGWADREAEQAYDRAREIALGLGDTRQLGNALYGLAYIHEARGEFPRALEAVEERLALAKQVGDAQEQIEAYDLMSCTLQHQGRFSDSLASADQALELSRTSGIVARATALGHHPVVSSNYWAGLALWFLGFADRGAERLLQAVRIATELNHPSSLALAQGRTARIFQLRREPQRTLTHARSGLDLAEAHDLPFQASLARPLLGWARALTGELDAGVAGIRDGLDRQADIGVAMDRPYGLGLLADALLAGGRTDEAMAVLDEARDHLGERAASFFWQSELDRLRGHALNMQGRTADAVAVLRDAVAMAQRQHARSLQLRATTALIQMLPDGSARSEAVHDLRSLYETFTEGFETPDLREAAETLGRAR